MNKGPKKGCGGITLWIALSFFCITSFALPEKPTIYALFVFDTNADKIGTFTEKNKTNFMGAFEKLNKSGKLGADIKISELTGKDVTAKNIFDYFKKLKHKRHEDIILFYYAGHGAWDEDRGQYLSLSSRERIYRTVLRDAMLFQQAKATFILTDSCYCKVDEELGSRVHIVYKEDPNKLPNLELFEDLFVNSKGLIDINATPVKSVSFYNKDYGGFWTFHLNYGLYNGRADYMTDKDKAVDWKTYLAKLDDGLKPWIKGLEDHKEIPKGSHGRQQSHPIYLYGKNEQGKAPQHFDEAKLRVINNTHSDIQLEVVFEYWDKGTQSLGEHKLPLQTLKKTESKILMTPLNTVPVGRVVHIRAKTLDGDVIEWNEKMSLIDPHWNGYSSNTIDTKVFRFEMKK